MLDFTSALYLGQRHRGRSLRPWASLTTGRPAVLGEPPEAGRIAAALASLTGVEHALVYRSTLHAFWDLFGLSSGEPGRVLVDAGAYPISRWCAERAVARGAGIASFPHLDPDGLAASLSRPGPRRGGTWILADGVCAGCGRPAPLGAYLALARVHGARLLVDDTQALGILGLGARADTPYGYGGGGSLRASGATGPEVVVVSSLAKSFGAPLAMMGGPRLSIVRQAQAGDARVHCSPPSSADLRAAEHALLVNRRVGDALRRRLAALVRRWRARLVALGLVPAPSLFPVQPVPSIGGAAAMAFHARLAALGVQAVLRRPACRRGPEVAILLTARHAPADVDRAAWAVARALGRRPPAVEEAG